MLQTEELGESLQIYLCDLSIPVLVTGVSF